MVVVFEMGIGMRNRSFPRDVAAAAVVWDHWVIPPIRRLGLFLWYHLLHVPLLAAQRRRRKTLVTFYGPVLHDPRRRRVLHLLPRLEIHRPRMRKRRRSCRRSLFGFGVFGLRLWTKFEDKESKFAVKSRSSSSVSSTFSVQNHFVRIPSFSILTPSISFNSFYVKGILL